MKERNFFFLLDCISRNKTKGEKTHLELLSRVTKRGLVMLNLDLRSRYSKSFYSRLCIVPSPFKKKINSKPLEKLKKKIRERICINIEI